MKPIKLKHLISEPYKQQNRILHENQDEGYGGSGWKHHEAIIAFAQALHAHSILDYGCGECTLSKQFRKMKFRMPVQEYDPAIPIKSRMPLPNDLVVCTDVLEHIEPDKLATVLEHINQLMRKGAYLVIATRAANKILPDGRNAHLIIEDTPWWIAQLKKIKWVISDIQDIRKGGAPEGAPHEVRVWITRR